MEIIQTDNTLIPCRACTREHLKLEMHFLYQDAILSDIFTDLTSLQINEFDGLPTYICNNCYNHLNTFTNFKRTCIKSDKTFRQRILDKKTNIFISELNDIQSKEDIHLADHEKFVCDICGEDFREKDQIEAHLRQHLQQLSLQDKENQSKNDSNKFKCTYTGCGKSYHFKNTFIWHIRTEHKGESECENVKIDVLNDRPLDGAPKRQKKKDTRRPGLKCCISHCKGSYRNTRMIHFPKCKEMKRKWFELCEIVNYNPNKLYIICGKHFEPRCFGKKKLKKDTFPTIGLKDPLNIN